MLSFHVVLGYHAGPPIPRLLVIFVFRFLSSILPTDPISENAFEAKRKKGMALALVSSSLESSCSA